MSGEILFLAHRLPFPPDRGDKIRSHHILRKLAELAPVHVATFAESERDLAQEGELAALCASHCLVRRSKKLPAAGIEALAKREPVSLAAFRDTRLSGYVARTLAERTVNTIFVFSGQMGQYVPPAWKGRVVIDLVDVDSAKFEAYAAERPGAMRWINAREGRLLKREEERLTRRAEHVLLVSDAEAQLLRSRLPAELGRRVQALRNGIDAAAFDPAATLPHRELTKASGPHLVFTGQMDYPPNIAAALRVIERLLPRIREVHPAAQFHVVGRAPARELLQHAGKEGCRIWGEVPDVRPFLAAADIVLAPLEIARGVQNKVLEAMAMARPVVLTPSAATGIDAIDGEHFAVEASDDALVARALALLEDLAAARSMGQAARRFVVETLGWPASLAPLAGIVGRPPVEQAQRDAA